MGRSEPKGVKQTKIRRKLRNGISARGVTAKGIKQGRRKRRAT